MSLLATMRVPGQRSNWQGKRYLERWVDQRNNGWGVRTQPCTQDGMPREVG
jgi:hypothetical protein